MAKRLSFYIDVHRISEAVARMVAGGNLQNAVGRVMIAAQDAEARRPLGDIQRLGNIGGRRDGLDVLRHLNEVDFCQPLDLLENRVFGRVDPVDNRFQAFMHIGHGQRQRRGGIGASAQALKPRPATARDQAQLLCDGARKWTIAETLETRPGIARILQDFGDIGQRLVQRATARRRWLDHRARPAPPRNQAFGLQRAQGFTHRETRYGVALAKVAFGRECIAVVATAQHLFAQFVSQFLVSRLCGQTLSPRPAALRA